MITVYDTIIYLNNFQDYSNIPIAAKFVENLDQIQLPHLTARSLHGKVINIIFLFEIPKICFNIFKDYSPQPEIKYQYIPWFLEHILFFGPVDPHPIH